MFVYDIDFCVATEIAATRSVYDTGFCVTIETTVVTEAYHDSNNNKF